jgi:Plasmid pRiA4b ORF-3-like protein
VPTSPGQGVFRLRITLVDVEPTVWRRLLVPATVRVAKLHDIFQAAMGWTNSHLHSFTIGGELYGMHFDDYPEEEIDEKEVTVLRAIGEHRRFSYEYDFGDSWQHEVVVEDFVRTPRGLKHAVCIDGQNACPPEDCGGVGGYAELLEVLADPEHEEHDHLLSWVGGTFDAIFFDLAGVNVALQHVR